MIVKIMTIMKFNLYEIKVRPKVNFKSLSSLKLV
jgi:hypothetical protein